VVVVMLVSSEPRLLAEADGVCRLGAPRRGQHGRRG